MNKKFVILVSALLVGLTGCSQTNSRQQNQIALAQGHYQKGNYILAAHLMNTFIENELFSSELAHAHYLRGLCYQQMGPTKQAAAMADFRFGLKKARSPEIRSLCHVALAHIFFEQNIDGSPDAIEHYQASLDDLPNTPPRDVVLYRLGISLQRLGRWEQADQYLSQCFNNFTDSTNASDARENFGARCYRILVAEAANLQIARQKVEQLQKKGISADWAGQTENGQLSYTVYTGRFDNYAAAREYLNRISADEPQATIVTAPPQNISTSQETKP